MSSVQFRLAAPFVEEGNNMRSIEYYQKVKGVLSLVVFSITAIFTLLKLFGMISWSWLWVLSPLWIFAGFMTLGIVVAIILLISMGRG
jgi:hypothetical protein